MNSLEDIGGVAPPPEYTNSGVYRSSAAGGSTKGPSSRLTVAPQNGVGHKKRRFRAQLAKKPELVTKWGCFRGREGGSLIQQRLLIETESEGWGHGKEMVEDVGLYGLEFVPNFVFQEKVHFDG